MTVKPITAATTMAEVGHATHALRSAAPRSSPMLPHESNENVDVDEAWILYRHNLYYPLSISAIF